MELIISDRQSENVALAQKALSAEQFLAETASQLSIFGLNSLKNKMRDGELAVFFRNNHFSTLIKHGDELFLLVTDLLFIHFMNYLILIVAFIH